MISRHIHKNLIWVDLERPTKDEVSTILQEFHIHPTIGDELIAPTLRAKAELHDNAIYLILKFPDTLGRNGESVEKEIDFIIGRDFIITAHYETFDAIFEFKKMFEVSSILARKDFGKHAGFLFYSMIKIIYGNLELKLDEINESLKKIEHKIFQGEESKMVREISNTHRKILDIKQTIRFHGEILKSFETAGRHFFGNEFSYHLESITSEYQKVSTTLDGHKEILKDLKETNDSLLTTKTNQVMKVLTFITFTVLPFSVTSGILGMNAPFTQNIDISTIVLVFSLSLLFGIVVFTYFKLKKWL